MAAGCAAAPSTSPPARISHLVLGSASASAAAKAQPLAQRAGSGRVGFGGRCGGTGIGVLADLKRTTRLVGDDKDGAGAALPQCAEALGWPAPASRAMGRRMGCPVGRLMGRLVGH
ncbi:MAG: hypothetical protein U1F49_17945 [Rubrivivax sp.]